MKYAIAAVIVLASVASAFAQPVPVDGEVTKINKEQSKITLKHGPIPNLDMDGMTMVFTVADAEMITAVKVGDKVTFEADRIKGKLTIVKLDAVK